MLGISAILMGTGLLTDKRKTLSSPQTVWLCNALMMTWYGIN